MSTLTHSPYISVTGKVFKGSARLEPNTVVRLPVDDPGERWELVERLTSEVNEARQAKAKADAEWVPEQKIEPVRSEISGCFNFIFV